MTINKTETVFDNESGEKTYVFEHNYNLACAEIGFSVTDGAVSVKGKISGDDSDHELGFIDLKTGEIVTVADGGIYSLLGCETLYSVTFTGVEATAFAKFIN